VAFQSHRRWRRACRIATEHRREHVEPPRFGGRNLLVVLVADLAAIFLEPWLCVRCGRPRRF
jgi:hypothetical protein